MMRDPGEATSKRRFLSRKSLWRVARGLILVLALLAVGRVARTAKPDASASAGSGEVVARVGRLTVTRDELESRLQAAIQTVRSSSGSDVGPDQLPLLRRQVLESLIWNRLLTVEAERLGVERNPFAASVQARARPDRREVERNLWRRMTAASISYLPLRRRDFMQEPYPPTELEVITSYQQRLGEFQRPPEIEYSMIVVNQPALSPAQLLRADLREAWGTTMERRADSLIAAIAAGTSFDDAALASGGALRALAPTGGRPHANFRGTESDLEALETTPEGSVLRRSVAWSPGRAIVRVNARHSKRVAPLAEAGPGIFESMYAVVRERATEQRLRALYERLGDSLRAPAQRVRYAVVDTSKLQVKSPTAAEIERHYQLHRADYASFDSERGVVVTLPLESASETIRMRLIGQRKFEAAQDLAARIAGDWAGDKGGARFDPGAVSVRDRGIVPLGAPVDTGRIGRVLSDSLARRDWIRGMVTFWFGPNLVVGDVGETIPSHLPTFQQARGQLAERMAADELRKTEAEARALWERQPDRFRQGRTIYFSRLIVTPPDVLDVHLEREEVERYYRLNPAEYGAAPVVHAAQLLIAPRGTSPEANAEARRTAQELLERARSGEDWWTLVKAHSMDEATRDNGGDIGSFTAGTMLPELEAALFKMSPGEIRGPIRTREGWHLVKCVDLRPLEMTPLAYCYANVASDLASERIPELTHHRADSLARLFRTPSEAKALAARSRMQILTHEHEDGDRAFRKHLLEFFETLEKTPAGRLVPVRPYYAGLGVAIVWVDSIRSSHVTSWNRARERAFEAVREDRAELELRRRQQRLDSLFQAGWKLDDLGGATGGLESRLLQGPGTALRELGGVEILDSLVFGRGTRAAALAPGSETSWLEMVGGPVRIRLDAREEPDSVRFAARLDISLKVEGERKLLREFNALKKHHVVRILDKDLAGVDLPEPVDR